MKGKVSLKILVPLNNKEYLDKYIESGAGEFYVGFYDKEWEKTFGEYSDINRLSGYKELANQYTFDEILDLIKLVKSKDKSIFITFNASIYSDEELQYIKGYMERLKHTLVDGVIVSTIELVNIAKEVGIFSVISTIAGIYNSDMVDFYKENGAGRVILPRDLTLEEIESIVKNDEKMEYEVFIMRNGCVFSDAHCLGFHRKERCSICADIKNAQENIYMEEEGFIGRHNIELTNDIYNRYFHSFACGLCAIYDFVKMNISACKIVGRTDDCKSVCEDIALISKNINIAKDCKNRDEYLEKMIFPENKTLVCRLGLSCYYPELRF